MSTSTILDATLVLLLLFIVRFLRKHFSYWQSQGIACDSPNWLLGNFTEAVRSKSLCQLFLDYYEKYKMSGPFVGFYCFTQPTVFVVDPDLIKRVLITDFWKFNNHMMYCNEEDDPLTGQLFNLTGAKWRNMRNKLSPNFTTGKIKAMFPLVLKIGQEFVEVFRKTIATDAVVDIPDLMNRFTSDVTGSCAFGIEINSLQSPESEFRKMCHKSLGKHRYGILGYIIRLCFPGLARKLHIKETLGDVEKFFLNLVKDTVDYREQNQVRRNDFMDMLIDLKNNKLMKSEHGEELTNLTFNQVAAQAFLFMLAGYESSSTNLGFALYELAQNQKVQEKAREEVSKVLENHNNEFTYECLKEMVYLEQIMQETLRLYPIAYVMTRQALQDYVVPGYPEYVIKKGMPIFIPAGAIHRDERYYPKPNVFNPDHFSSDKVLARDSVLNLTFGDGPRSCIGIRFAKMQTLIGLALLLKNFKFSVCERTSIPMKFKKINFMMYPEIGVFLKAETI